MKQYEVTAVFWRGGLEVPVGTVLSMSDSEAKYLKHALREPQPEAEPAPAVEPAPESVVETDAKPAEEPPHRKARRKAEHADGGH